VCVVFVFDLLLWSFSAELFGKSRSAIIISKLGGALKTLPLELICSYSEIGLEARAFFSGASSGNRNHFFNVLICDDRRPLAPAKSMNTRHQARTLKTERRRRRSRRGIVCAEGAGGATTAKICDCAVCAA
jgi:hypothetical protein